MIIYILWIAIAGITILQYKDSLSEVQGWTRAIAICILIVGSPFVAVGTLVSDILDIILPPGWNDGD